MTDEDLARLDAWWRAANYLSLGQIYLLDNPLLHRPLTRDDIKPRLLGHWGTTPGLAYHGYPWLIHRLTYRRTGHANMHVRGYKEEGTTTTPFDMVMLNDLDRYRLVIDVIDRVPGLAPRYAGLRQRMTDARREARAYTRAHGEDIPSVSEWTWDLPRPQDDERERTYARRRPARPAIGMKETP